MTRRIRPAWALVLAALVIFPAAAPAGDAASQLVITVDPRVELTSIVFRLAGNPEYRKGHVEAYNEAVDEHFGDFADHETVALARRLRAERGISYNAVPQLALHLTDVASCAERVPFDPLPPRLDDRWDPASASGFAAALCRFARDTDFAAFRESHAELYAETEARMRTLMEDQGILTWFDRFFGPRDGSAFHLELALLNGPNNYGASVLLPDGEEFHSVLGVWETDDAGLPSFRPDVLSTIVHEFTHSYTNPLIDDHADALAGAGEALFAHVADAMTRQAYGTWRITLYESLVRACTIRWVETVKGADLGRRLRKFESRRSFYWVDDLADLMAEYEGDRATYPDLAAFMPRVVEFFDAWALEAEERIAAVHAAWDEAERLAAAKAPRIVSIDPPDGAVGVDPALREIVIVFDRTMMNPGWSVMVRGDGTHPKTTSVAYDEGCTVFRMQVELQPGTTYSYGLNSPGGGGFRDTDGNRLMPVDVEFATSDAD